MSFTRAAALPELWVGELRSVVVAGAPVLLVRLGDGVRAYEDRCAHKGVALSAGTLAGTVLTCATHGWQYDVATGRGVNPERTCLRAFAVRVDGDDVLVDVGDFRARADLTELSRPSDDVGPVLQEGPEALAIVAAIRHSNADVRVLDRGSYVRVLCARRCVVTRAAIEAELGRPFRMRRDLELVVSAFKGRFHVSDEEASWELVRADVPAPGKGA